MRTKLILPFLILAFLVSGGCGTPAKVASTNDKQESWARTIESAANCDILLQLDTSKHDVTEITLTRREYYPPQCGEGDSRDSVKAGEPGKAASPSARLKSEEIVTIRKDKEQKGIRQELTTKDTTTTIRDSTRMTEASTYDSEPTKDPQRYRYIFYIIVAVAIIGLALFLYFKRSGILTRLTSLFRGL